MQTLDTTPLIQVEEVDWKPPLLYPSNHTPRNSIQTSTMLSHNATTHNLNPRSPPARARAHPPPPSHTGDDSNFVEIVITLLVMLWTASPGSQIFSQLRIRCPVSAVFVEPSTIIQALSLAARFCDLDPAVVAVARTPVSGSAHDEWVERFGGG